MKKILFILSILLIASFVEAQTGIGTTTPNASAKLDVSATNKGFLPPRVALTGVYDVSTIPTPATGLLVYCNGTGGLASGYYFFNGTAWATIATEGGSGSVAAEFGTQILGSSVAVNSATPVDVLSFTLPSAGTWEIIYFLRAQGAAGFAGEFGLYDPSGTIVPNSEILAAFGEQASTGTGVVRVTTTGSVTYKLKAWASYGTYGVYSEFNGRTGVTWKKISGNAPVTGQSVDYGIARYTGADVGSLAAGALVGFDASAAGNLSWSANKFTLKANKTYEIESSLAIYNTSSGSAGRFQIYDYTNAISLANSLFMSQNGTGGNSQSANTPMKCIVTPTSDIQVGIRLLDFYGGAPGIIGNAVLTGSTSASNASYFVVKQIGSSAIVNPWTLSGTNTYNTSGNVGIGTSSPTTTLTIGSATGTIGGEILLNPTSTQYEGGQIIFKKSLIGSTVDWTIDQYGTSSSNARFRIFNGSSENNGIAILENGYLGIGTGTPSNKLHIQSSDQNSVYIESTTADNNGMMVLNANTNQNWSSNWHEFIYFRNQGNNIGSIIGSNGGNMVSFNTSSDYRLKTDFKGYNGLDLVNKIKTYDYVWKRDSSRMYGFVAHELQEVIPYLVSGTKDAVDADGKIIPQSVDYSKLTPILVKAIQEQDIIIKVQIEKLIKLSKEKDSIEKRLTDLELMIKKLIEKNN
jgi:hypothetical protein